MATQERSVVVGVFHDRERAHDAIRALRDAGFDDNQIGFVMRQAAGSEPSSGMNTNAESHVEPSASTGAVTGGLVGGILGALATGLIPGIGPVIAGGLLAGVLGGAVVGATAGGFLGSLTSMGVPEHEAKYYEDEFNAGRGIVTVKAGNRYDDAEAILREYDAYNIHTQNNQSDRTESTSPNRLANPNDLPLRDAN